MISPSGKLRDTVQQAGAAVREAAEGTGKLVIAALVTASAALLLAFAALVLVLKGKPGAAG